MPEKTPAARAIARLLQRYVDQNNITSRASQVSEYELRSFTVDEIEGVLKQISPTPKKAGSVALCGPDFNRRDPMVKLLQIPIWASFVKNRLISREFLILYLYYFNTTLKERSEKSIFLRHWL